MTQGNALRRILIVEDDAASAELERRVLIRSGYAPVVAPSLTEAKDLLAADDFAALLLDYRLPDGDAWDLVATARALVPHLPVILVTAMGNEAVAAEAVLRGVSEYIRKADGFHDQLGSAVERVTRLAQAQEQLRRNDSLFRTIADHATDAIVLLDGRDAILWASAAAERVFAAASQDVVGRKLADFLHPDDRAQWPSDGAWKAATRLRFRCRDRDGQYLTFEPTFQTINDGATARTLGVLRDVTDRLQLEERLRHNQRLEALGQLTGGIAHDFNNLLAVIIANLDVLLAAVDEGTPTREQAVDALDAALRGADLTDRLLAFARRQPLRPEPCDVNAAIRAMMKLLGRTLGDDVSIELALAPDLWPTLVDRLQLETALTNLATNARDAMPRGGRLTITTRNTCLDPDNTEGDSGAASNDYAQIEVCDTGSGIPPEVLDRIFEPFFTTKELGKGTGLGLSMVFGFIKQSGGHITAASERGQGTAIRLYLPRCNPAAAPAPIPPKPLEPAGDGRTILVVEDNAKLREITVRQLRGAGYVVREASEGASALAILESGVAIDLLFTDIVMPGEPNGCDLAEQGRLRRPGLRIVLTSGFSDLQGARKGAGVSDHVLLHKPYRQAALLRVIREALDGETQAVA